MEKHLEKISEILKGFVLENNFNRNYISIKGKVTPRSHYRLGFHCDGIDSFDNLTIREVRSLGTELHNKIRLYLEDNDIDNTVYISTLTRDDYTYAIDISFKENLIVRL